MVSCGEFEGTVDEYTLLLTVRGSYADSPAAMKL